MTSFEVYNEYVFKIKFDLIQCTCTVILFMFNLCKTIVMQQMFLQADQSSMYDLIFFKLYVLVLKIIFVR